MKLWIVTDQDGRLYGVLSSVRATTQTLRNLAPEYDYELMEDNVNALSYKTTLHGITRSRWAGQMNLRAINVKTPSKVWVVIHQDSTFLGCVTQDYNVGAYIRGCYPEDEIDVVQFEDATDLKVFQIRFDDGRAEIVSAHRTTLK